MIYRKIFTLVVLPVICLGFFLGCAGRTPPYIPNQVLQVNSDMARIIFTRESQIAGARWDLDLVDIGENIEPNAMISYRFCRSNDFMRLEDLLRSDINRDIMNDFFWRNPEKITSLYCGDGKSECDNEYGLGLFSGDIGLIWETGVALGMSGHTAVEMVEDGQSLSDQLDLANRLIRLISGEEMTIPPDPIVKLFFDYFRREKIVSLMEKLRTNTLDYSTIKGKSRFIGKTEFKRSIDLGMLGYYRCPEDGLQAFKSDEANTNIVFTSTVPKYLIKDLKKGPCQPDDYLIDNRFISRNIQVMGKIGVGETIIWDRKPGAMRLAMIWYDGSDIMPRDVEVEPGKTYYLHYTFRHPKTERWELVDVK